MKWFLWGLCLLVGIILGAMSGCASQKVTVIRPDPPSQHIPSLWCELQDKIYKTPCQEPREAANEII